MTILANVYCRNWTLIEWRTRYPVYGLDDLSDTSIRVRTPGGTGAIVVTNNVRFRSVRVKRTADIVALLGQVRGSATLPLWVCTKLRLFFEGFEGNLAGWNGNYNAEANSSLEPYWWTENPGYGPKWLHNYESPITYKWRIYCYRYQYWLYPPEYEYVMLNGPASNQLPDGVYTFGSAFFIGEPESSYVNATCTVSRSEPIDWDGL